MKKLSLVQKIGGGFGLILVLVFIVSLLSWSGLGRISSGLTTYNRNVDNSSLYNRIQAEMLFAQMNVKDYVISGNPAIVTQYESHMAAVERNIKEVIQHAQNSKDKQDLQRVTGKLDEFKSAFKQIIALKNSRNRLFDEQLAVIGPKIAVDLGNIMDTAHNDGDEVASYLSGMALRNLLLGRIYVFSFLSSSDLAYAEQAEQEFAQFDEFAKKMLVLLFDDVSKEKALQSKDAAAEYIRVFKELVAVIQKRDAIARQALEEIGPSIAQDFARLTEAVQQEQKTLGQALQSRADNFKAVILLIAITSLLLGALLAWLLTNAITRPILKTASFADAMAQGDFSGKLDIDQQDEIGKMSEALNSMVAQLGTMLRDIIQTISTLSASSEQLKGIATEMSEGSNDTSQKSTTVAAAAEEMSINMNSVAAAMEEASSNINLVTTATEEMTSSVNRISEGASRAREISGHAVNQSAQTSEKMEALGIAASKIGRITETITEISEQTNLLALNATIEAARAGEAGKGFAVVANEIKELARQTADATIDIKNQIESVQGTTSSTMEDMRKISEIITEINEMINTIGTSVEEQASVTDEITANIGQSSVGIAEVNENVAQSSVVVNDISKDISEVNRSASQMAARSTEVEKSADNLSDLARQLREMVSNFRV